MIAYYERYQAGEHVAVWSELIALGKKVREEPVLAEALKVCTEIVRRARANLRMLHTRLLDLGYLFAEADVALVDAGHDVDSFDPHEVFNLSHTEPVVAVVARSDASEW